MALDKNAIRGIGLLAFVGVLAASGFFVAKPQIEEGFKLASETADVNQATSTREVRLVKLQNEKENMAGLSEEVDGLLGKIPSDKKVSGIAEAVIQSMPAGVQLLTFSHGDLVAGPPPYASPKVALSSPPAPFTLTSPGAAASETDDEEKDSTTAKPAEEGTPAFALAPFTVTVSASSVESLTEYLDILQNQDRLVSVVSVTSTGMGAGETTATIYGYAFAGSTEQIKAWENPPTAEEE